MNDTSAYVHRKGIHCESACQCNILAAGGHDVSEDEVFGLDGGFGFAFYPARGNQPDIVVGKQEILPLRAARLMGIEVSAHTPKASSGLARLLESVPAVLTRVDLGLLPHWGLEGRASFGGYFINVVRRVGDTFEISDPAIDSPATISAADLDAARSSRNSPPLNPNWRAYTFGPLRSSPRLELVGPVAVRNLCRDVLKPGNRSLGIPGLKLLASTAPSWPQTKRGDVEDVDLSGNVTQTSALSRQLVHLGRQIEQFGTGGGMHRPMIGRFLERVADSTGNPVYSDSAALFAESGRLWQDLGTDLLVEGTTDSRSDLEGLVHKVRETAGNVMDLEKRALSGLLRL
jgi:hypothetical protein